MHTEERSCFHFVPSFGQKKRPDPTDSHGRDTGTRWNELSAQLCEVTSYELLLAKMTSLAKSLRELHAKGGLG